MSKRILPVVAIILTFTLLVGCVTQPTEESTSATTAPEMTLTVKSTDKSVTLNWDDIKEMPAYEGPGGRMNSVGEITPPWTYKGVTVEDLCNLVGGFTEDNSVKITAKDGYSMTFSYDQIASGDYDTYDVSSGEAKPFDGKLQTVIAYKQQGEFIPSDEDGPLRLAILGSDKIVTDGHWWIKWVESIEVKEALDQWTLHLEGVRSEDVDSGSFETGAAPNCHGTSWTDDKEHTWEGIPLWLLDGRVDDENKHEDKAFNDELAESGYEIDLIASDGYTITLDSGRVARNNDIILAYLMNDRPLPDKHWPLRLVGPKLEKSSMIGAVETIKVNVQ